VLIKYDVSRDVNTIGLKVKAAVSFMVGGVAKEDAQGGAGCKLVGGCGGEVRITGSAKDTKMVISGLVTK
jgi:hypothetical protein